MSKNTPENKNLKPKTSRINLNTINSILNLAQIDLHVRLTQSNQANKRHAPSVSWLRRKVHMTPAFYASN